MTSKVRVYGKAQNRTALGIINAYKIMYPNAKFEDFEKAFPKELNPDSGWPVNFKRLEECKSKNEKDFWFVEANEVIKLQDGTKMVLCKMWTKSSFERLVSHAKQYDIEVAEFVKTGKFEKGGYRLEYLNGYIPPKSGKKGIPAWILFVCIIIAIALAALAYYLGNNGKKTEFVKVEKTVVVHDTVYMQKIAELETEFNAAQFEKNKAELNDNAKFVLHDLAKLLEKNPTVKLKIEGHTSAEGDVNHNQKLSEERAKVTVDFLISQGVDESRLSYEGLGSSKLKNVDNPMAEENRRTEFIVYKEENND